MGYVRHPSGEVMKDPDEQARAVIETVFAQFERRGTLYGVLRYLVEQGLRLPYRLAGGARKGELEWRRPNRVTLSNLLHNPIYAGAYVYGRRPTDARRKLAGAARDRARAGDPRAVAGATQRPIARLHRLGAVRTQPAPTRGQYRPGDRGGARAVRRCCRGC